MIVTMLILFFLTFFLTAFCRHYALTRNVLDIPNHRSSHTIPTPRGGGMAFAVVFLVYLLVLGHEGIIAKWDAIGLFVAGFFVAGLGFVDDHCPIPPVWRLVGHFSACGFALFCFGGLVSVVWNSLTGQIFITMVVLFYLAWILNLYNFMDGIDGLAALEGICVCFGGALVYWLYGNASLMPLPLAMGATLAGFLCWNFPRARIFMGDGGSGFLGLMIGLFSIQATHVPGPFFWSWLILSGVFNVDATVTLVRRIFEGRRIYKAHRHHAYQHATDSFQSHIKVTTGVVVINIVWLLPLAIIVGGGYLNGMIGLMIAYLPLTILVAHFQENSKKAK